MTDLATNTLKLLRRRDDARDSTPREDGTDPGVAAEAHGATDIGLVRPRNEDQFLVATLERAVLVEQSSIERSPARPEIDHPQGRLLMVADGMGGVDGGDIASAVAVDAMTHYAFAMMPWVMASKFTHADILSEGLQAALEECEARIQRVARRKALDPHMGTTLTIAYVTWPVLHVVHVGDTRCYVFRDGELTRLTRDHTIAQELVDKNALTEEDAAKSRFASMLTNAVGGNHRAIIDLHRFELKEGDELLLCSDGLSGVVADAQIRELLASGGTVRERADALIRAAKHAGGEDNITAVLAHF